MTDTSDRHSYRDTFSRAHAVLIVVHVTSSEQAVRNSRIAHDAGADGVFLIDHGSGGSPAVLRSVWADVTAALPGWWVGVNNLGASALETARAWPADLVAVWEDHTVRSADGPGYSSARTRAQEWAALGNPPLLFGGVAFKYGGDETLRGDELAELAAASREFVDVITTSGPGTGHAADAGKIATIRAAIGDHPMAIASGITVDNVTDYLPHADCFLVASGIRRTFDELDPQAVAALVERVRQG
jgi:predicted TIM-barrel enzyme